MKLIPRTMNVGNPKGIPINPCPFCKNENEGNNKTDMEWGLTVDRINDHARWHQVVCMSCYASGPMGDYIKGAIEMWNKANIHGKPANK